MENQNQKFSNINNQGSSNQFTPGNGSNGKTTVFNRLFLTVPGEQSFDLENSRTFPSTIALANAGLETSIDGIKRAARFSNVSTSYAQFLKQRDMDKGKMILSHEDQRLLLSHEWAEDAKDSDPYISVLNRLGEAIQDSETLVEFVKKSFSIITNTYAATFVLALLTVFQIILFFIGVKYLNDCPIEQNLPVYLLVAGSMGLVRVLNLLWKQFRRRRVRHLEGVELDQEEETENNGSRFTDAVLNLFLFAWFIVGQVWTWKAYMPNFEFGLDSPNRYCHRNVYIFTLVHIGFVYIMFLALIIFLIALTCCATFPHLIVKTPR